MYTIAFSVGSSRGIQTRANVCPYVAALGSKLDALAHLTDDAAAAGVEYLAAHVEVLSLVEERPTKNSEIGGLWPSRHGLNMAARGLERPQEEYGSDSQWLSSLDGGRLRAVHSRAWFKG